MTKICKLVASAALLSCGLAMAQQGPSAGQNSDSSREQKVEGCLTRTNGLYVITGGHQPKQYRIIGGNTDALKNKQGHTVQVIGTLGQSDPVANTVEPPNEGTTTGATYSTLVITSVKDITSNCSYPGTGK